MNKTLTLTVTAMMTALSIVANLFTITLSGSNALSFTLAICFLAGIYLGALPGAIVGFLGDLIGHLIHPLGPYNLFVAVSSTLFGVIAALVYRARMHKLLKLAVALVITFVVCSCLLNTFGLWLQYSVKLEPSAGENMLGIGTLIDFFKMDKSALSKTFWAYLIGRLPWMLINLAVNAAILAVLQQTRTLDRLFAAVNRKIGRNKSKPKAD